MSEGARTSAGRGRSRARRIRTLSARPPSEPHNESDWKSTRRTPVINYRRPGELRTSRRRVHISMREGGCRRCRAAWHGVLDQAPPWRWSAVPAGGPTNRWGGKDREHRQDDRTIPSAPSRRLTNRGNQERARALQRRRRSRRGVFRRTVAVTEEPVVWVVLHGPGAGRSKNAVDNIGREVRDDEDGEWAGGMKTPWSTG